MRILVVEDEQLIRRAILKHLAGYTPPFSMVLEAWDGEQAERLIDEFAPDIVLMDIRIPGKSGLEVLEQLSGQGSRVRVIIISGYREFEYARRAMHAGAGAYLLKPVQQAELYRTLDQVRGELQEQRRERERLDRYQDATRRDAIHSALENIAFSAQEALSFSPWYGVILIDMDTLGREAEILAVAETASSDLEDAIALPYGPRRCLLVLGFPAADKRRLKQIAGDTLRRLLRLDGVRCAVSTSGIGAGYTSLHSLYLQAAERSLERLVRGDDQVIDDDSPLPPMELAPYAGTLNAVVEQVVAGDEARVARAIRSVTDLLRRDGLLCHNNLKSATDHLTARLQGVLGRFSLSAAEPFRLEECYDLAAYHRNLTAYLCGHAARIHTARGEGREQGFARALAYIDGHFEDSLTLEQVAEIAGLSANYFSQQFTKRMRCTFIDYLTRLRMEKAKELLGGNSPLTVAQVGVLVGYENTRYFSRLFHRHTGLRPREYRETRL